MISSNRLSFSLSLPLFPQSPISSKPKKTFLGTKKKTKKFLPLFDCDSPIFFLCGLGLMMVIFTGGDTTLKKNEPSAVPPGSGMETVNTW